HGGPGFGQRTIEGRETQIVADRQPQPSPRKIGKHCRFARSIVARLPITLAASEIDIEHMDLVVTRCDLALWINKESAIDGLIGGNPDRQRADMNVDAELPRQLAESCKS